MQVSVLCDNLVVQFTDYLSGEHFFSFLGDNETDLTAIKLLELSKEKGFNNGLKLVPSVAADKLDKSRFRLSEDKDNFDYIYNVGEQVRMEGGHWAIKRKHRRFFEKNFEHSVKELDLTNDSIKEEILNLFNDWTIDKGEKMPAHYSEKEFRALKRFLGASKAINPFALGIYANQALVAVSIIELLPKQYALSHFQKTRTSLYKGINAYLNNEVAKKLVEKNVLFLNCEQDLGLPGLRESKESYSPSSYLMKYYLSAV